MKQLSNVLAAFGSLLSFAAPMSPGFLPRHSVRDALRGDMVRVGNDWRVVLTRMPRDKAASVERSAA
jgi:hypothetical protein